MNSFRRLLAPLLLCVFALAACKPSSENVATSAPPAPPGDKPVLSQPIANAQKESADGKYSTLVIAQPAEKGSKVEVLEFFGYFCSHCKDFDPALTAWAKKNAGTVIFKRVPVAFRENMVHQQRMYYALQAMGKLDGLHEKTFHAVQVERRALSTEAEVIEFVAQNGVDKTKFKELYDSFSIQSQARNATNLQANYKIDSVPNIAIDGRFITSKSHASKQAGVEEGGAESKTLQIMDELVAQVLKERGSAAKPGK